MTNLFPLLSRKFTLESSLPPEKVLLYLKAATKKCAIDDPILFPLLLINSDFPAWGRVDGHRFKIMRKWALFQFTQPLVMEGEVQPWGSGSRIEVTARLRRWKEYLIVFAFLIFLAIFVFSTPEIPKQSLGFLGSAYLIAIIAVSLALGYANFTYEVSQGRTLLEEICEEK